jgi:AbrB family looped-hinge helix DNA binding protein
MRMQFVTLGKRNQIVIPVRLRSELKIRSGTRIAIERSGAAIVLRPIPEDFIDRMCGATKGLSEYREKTHRDDKER